MSRMYVHERGQGPVSIPGSERAYLADFINTFFAGILRFDESPTHVAPLGHERPAATHRCTLCTALWCQLTEAQSQGIPELVGSWTLISPVCHKCCDNSDDFLKIIEPLKKGEPGFQRAHWLRPLLTDYVKSGLGAHYGQVANQLVETLLTSMAFEDQAITYKGKPINTSELVLNTALAAGSDPIKLMARIHGQCERFLWVSGQNRLWLANIIKQGLDSKLLRPTGEDCAWQKLINRLRASMVHEPATASPMVFSFSGTGNFPNVYLARKHPEFAQTLVKHHIALDDFNNIDEITQAYDLLDPDTKWRLSFEQLLLEDRDYTLEGCTRELKPDNFDTYRFGHNLSLYDLMPPKPVFPDPPKPTSGLPWQANKKFYPNAQKPAARDS